MIFFRHGNSFITTFLRPYFILWAMSNKTTSKTNNNPYANKPNLKNKNILLMKDKNSHEYVISSLGTQTNKFIAHHIFFGEMAREILRQQKSVDRTLSLYHHT